MRKLKISTPALIIALFCIAVYAVVLFTGAYRFYVNVVERRAAAEREFYELADLASAAGVLGFMDVPFQQAIHDSLEKTQILRGVIISGPSGEYAFERERGAVIRWERDSPRFIKRLGVSSTPAVPLRINGLRNVSISAGFGAIDQNYAITTLKHCLIVIMTALAAAFLTFLVESTMSKRSARSLVQDGEDNGKPESGDAGGKEEFSFEQNFEILEDETLPIEAVEDEDAPFHEDAASFEAGLPKGLYAPGSNIGWDVYTIDRLDSELHRCASIEQDLTLMIAAFSGEDALTGEQYNEFAGMAVNFFNLRDLIFENGERGITIILPNMDLDQGLARAEDFRSYLAPAFEGLPDFRIGLSSRSGRLVDAGRLFFEAGEALRKALRDPASPIIALRCDPEKYRAFLRSRGK
ncbi:MAG: hypothetical protein LBU18_02645 [Treponema sp.]|jgi:hypothetical protein|nr:hypothetical protein [Treponema sp.]